MQAIRVLGLLGALDPYKRKLNKYKGSVSSRQGLPVSEAIHKNAGAQNGNRQGNVVYIDIQDKEALQYLYLVSLKSNV